MPDSPDGCPPPPLPLPHPSPGTSLLAGDSGVLAFRTATGGGRGLLARVAITWPWAFSNSWGVTAWTCRPWAGAGAATLAEFTTHGSAPITWEETTQGPAGVRPVSSPALDPNPHAGRGRDLNHFTLLHLSFVITKEKGSASGSRSLYSISRVVVGRERVCTVSHTALMRVPALPHFSRWLHFSDPQPSPL